jgi:hypothetical protein
LGEERAAGERSTHQIDPMPRQPVGECADKRQQTGRSYEHGIRIEPELSVVAGLQPEVPRPSVHQRQHRLRHRGRLLQN